jgi:hypothetical protein
VPLGGDIIEAVSPTKEDTTAGRLLEKRGDGGYMVIVQVENAKKRHEDIEAKGLSKVIFTNEHGDAYACSITPRASKVRHVPGGIADRVSKSIPTDPVRTTRRLSSLACRPGTHAVRMSKRTPVV